MEKRKKPDFDDLPEELQQFLAKEAQLQFDLLTPEEQDAIIAEQEAQSIFGPRKEHPNYYQRSDYRQLSSNGVQIEDWLLPFWNVDFKDNIKELCNRIEKESLGMPAAQRREDVRNYLYCLFLNYEDDDLCHQWQLFGPLWLLERMHKAYPDLADNLDIVLETLKQSRSFLSDFLREGKEEYLCAVIAQFGCNHLDELRTFLFDEGESLKAKTIVFDALLEIYLDHEELQQQIVELLTSYLRFRYEACLKGAPTDDIYHYAHAIVTVHIDDAMDIIDEMYGDERLHIIGAEDIEEMDGRYGDETIVFGYEYHSLDDYVQHGLADVIDDGDSFLWTRGTYRHIIPDEDEYDEDWDNYEPLTPYQILCDETKPCNKYTLFMEVTNAPSSIWREIVVPSNIRLEQLANVLLMTLGPEYKVFHSGSYEPALFWTMTHGEKKYSHGAYLWDQDIEEDENNIDATKHTLGDMLHSVGDQFLLSDDDQHQHWECTVKLVDAQDDFDSEQKVFLVDGANDLGYSFEAIRQWLKHYEQGGR